LPHIHVFDTYSNNRNNRKKTNYLKGLSSIKKKKKLIVYKYLPINYTNDPPQY